MLFFDVLLKLKMATKNELTFFFVGANKVRNNLLFTITLPTIWNFANDFT